MKAVTLLLAIAAACFLETCLVNGLKCFCDLCKDSNQTCETEGGYCFASISLEDGNEQRTYSCVRKRLHRSQPDRPIFCGKPESDNASFAIECCGTDYCNKDLRPEVTTRTPTTQWRVDGGQSQFPPVYHGFSSGPSVHTSLSPCLYLSVILVSLLAYTN